VHQAGNQYMVILSTATLRKLCFVNRKGTAISPYTALSVILHNGEF